MKSHCDGCYYEGLQKHFAAHGGTVVIAPRPDCPGCPKCSETQKAFVATLTLARELVLELLVYRPHSSFHTTQLAEIDSVLAEQRTP